MHRKHLRAAVKLIYFRSEPKFIHETFFPRIDLVEMKRKSNNVCPKIQNAVIVFTFMLIANKFYFAFT